MKFFALILFGLIAISFAEDSGSETDSYYSYYSDSSEESIEERILGGSIVTDIKQYSYQCGIINVKSESFVRVGKKITTEWDVEDCGGSIIHPKVVLTAAHCVENPQYVVVFHGTTIKIQNPNSPGTIIVDPINVKSHEGYKSDKINGIINDIAVINLPESIIKEGDLYTSVIPLASSTWTNCDGEGEASGWGLIDTSVETNQLRSVNVSTLAYETCKKSDSFLIKEQHICIDGSQFKGTCSGDSGGPFVQFRANGERYLCGVTSYGFGSYDKNNNVISKCRNNKPKVFASVSFFNDNQWICNNTDHQVGCNNENENNDDGHKNGDNNYNDKNNGNVIKNPDLDERYGFWKNGIFHSHKNGVWQYYRKGVWFYTSGNSLKPFVRR